MVLHHQENCTQSSIGLQCELLSIGIVADQGAIVPFFVGHMLSGSDFIRGESRLKMAAMADGPKARAER